jgi:HPt (histidine-containing phosphotransfer) domain-containing protein
MDKKKLKEKAGESLDYLTPEQLKRLEESIQQLGNGQWKSHDEVMKLAKSWLQK